MLNHSLLESGHTLVVRITELKSEKDDVYVTCVLIIIVITGLQMTESTFNATLIERSAVAKSLVEVATYIHTLATVTVRDTIMQSMQTNLVS